VRQHPDNTGSLFEIRQPVKQALSPRLYLDQGRRGIAQKENKAMSHSQFPQVCRSCVPPAPYIGGKRLLAKRLVSMIEAVPHESYIEPFLGMGGGFLKRTKRARSEVVNDISKDVVNLFRILQRHYVAFMEMLKFQISSRSEFDRLLAQPAETLTDLERAARFLYLQRLSFGGRVRAPSFGVSLGRPARFDITRLGSILEDISDRISGVIIENMPWQAIMDRYDSKDSLFYLDPPYYDCEKDYGDGLFSKADFTALAARLKGLKGRFILSLNDRPEIRNLFADFVITTVNTTYSVGKGNVPAREVIITNLQT
jgi:DNA adenine methylase